MSYEYVKAAIRAKGIPRNAKDVLICLADHVNQREAQRTGRHEAWPSRDTIAELMDMSRSSVNRGLNWLIDSGFIMPIGETMGGGLKHTTHYLLSVERVSRWNTLQPSKSVTVEHFDGENRSKTAQNRSKKCVTQNKKSVTVEHDQRSEPSSDQRIDQRTPSHNLAIGSGDLGEGLAATSDRASHEEEQSSEVDQNEDNAQPIDFAKRASERQEAAPASFVASPPQHLSAEVFAEAQAAQAVINAKRLASR